VTTLKTRKKLIEVALPLEAINISSAKEKAVRHGHPSNLHRWWARRPFTSARAIIFAQMVDDPSSIPELFPTPKLQDKERKRLFAILERLVLWENTNNEEVLRAAREEIWMSWRRTCADNAAHPLANEIFNRNKLPGFHDPFAGGGALPLEAQRLGLRSTASDLNPVALLINKAMIVAPQRFAGLTPVSSSTVSSQELVARKWQGVQGLVEDVKHYGHWMCEEAQKRIGHLYPKVEITASDIVGRPDMKHHVGEKLPVIAWVWARTVMSPNPAFPGLMVPLVTSYLLSSKPGKEAYVEPLIGVGSYQFIVKNDKPRDEAAARRGTKLSRGANFNCIMSNTPIPSDYIIAEAKAGRMGIKLMAIVAEGSRGRVYISPNSTSEKTALSAPSSWKPETPMPENPRWFSPPLYGLKEYGDIFTSRQLVALSTFSDLVGEVRVKAKNDAIKAGLFDDSVSFEVGGKGAMAYADAVALYLGLIVSKTADSNNSLCPWEPVAQCTRQLFGRQAIPMLWDFGEANPLHDSSGGLITNINGSLNATATFPLEAPEGQVHQANASTQSISENKVISTDPPYYDNIGYSDLSDFFYIWLKKSLSEVFPALFPTLVAPKADELVATPYRHGGKEKAEAFFLDGMTLAMQRLADQAHPSYPVTIYYAFKQTETDNNAGIASTGWETFLAAVIAAGFSIGGTWPIRSEMTAALKAKTNSLASSIVLVCRKRTAASLTITRRDLIEELRTSLPISLAHLQAGNVAPVDLAQAAIGPGMAIYSSYEKVIDASGNAMSVRDALILINEILDEQLSQQEVSLDADSRWAIAWFDSYAFENGGFGQAEQFAVAKNTSVSGLVLAGIITSGMGKVRLLRHDELPAEWAPETDNRLTVWEMLHHLIRLQKQGEAAASAMLARLGDKADAAKELAYRLYGICEKKKRSTEGQLYNDLITVWPDLLNQSKQAPAPVARPGEFELDA
jgi:putative DNA methylase